MAEEDGKKLDKLDYFFLGFVIVIWILYDFIIPPTIDPSSTSGAAMLGSLAAVFTILAIPYLIVKALLKRKGVFEKIKKLEKEAEDLRKKKEPDYEEEKEFNTKRKQIELIILAITIIFVLILAILYT